ncbi:erythrocyte binding protein [Histomonas meleagridis]|uniref:erythrocyte binding protein n=1 Tax=Histomonas meleagridis TaxID=135588 RepID=UPI00355A9EE2|nr:erythrocyte binding protein [Histomonas meleagridis]KAH0802442.1 erythrocyte binding protein [Histomonas meleagridis]
MERKKKAQLSKEKYEKLKFITQKKEEFQSKINALKKGWIDQMQNCVQQKELIDSRYDMISSKLEEIAYSLQSKIYEIKEKNQELNDSILSLKSQKQKIQAKRESNQLETSAEVDLELKLQQKAADLHHQINENKRKTEAIIEKKISLKKSYVRLIAQYKKLMEEIEASQNRQAAFRKKKALEMKKKHIEKEQKQVENSDEQMNQYLSLLAAAGQINFANKSKLITTVYQPPQSPKTESRFVVDSPQYNECIWLENNIKTLLSTGNYTEDDPVIRQLQEKLIPKHQNA